MNSAYSEADAAASSRRLTDHERKMFAVVTGEVPVYHLALLRGEFDGKDAAFIVIVSKDGDEYTLHPVAMLLTPELLDRATVDGEPPKEDTKR